MEKMNCLKREREGEIIPVLADRIENVYLCLWKEGGKEREKFAFVLEIP